MGKKQNKIKAFVEPMSPSSYHRISLYVFTTKFLQSLYLLSSNPFSPSLLNPFQLGFCPYHPLKQILSKFNDSLLSNPMVKYWPETCLTYQHHLTQLTILSLKEFLHLAWLTDLSSVSSSPDFQCWSAQISGLRSFLSPFPSLGYLILSPL